MSKSRVEKGRSSAQPPVVQPPVVLEIVPGKLNEHQWLHMTDEDEGYELVNDILEHVVNSACDVIYNKIINNRVIPFCVDKAEEMLTDMIKWRFLSHDIGVGEIQEDPSWTEDEAPPHANPDNWAQGVVPVVLKQHELSNQDGHQSPTSEPTTNDMPLEDSVFLGTGGAETEVGVQSPDEDASPSVERDDILSSFVDETSFHTETETSECLTDTSTPQVELASAKRTPRDFKPYRGKMPNYRKITLTPITANKKVTQIPPCNHASSNDLVAGMQGAPVSSKYGKEGNSGAIQKFTPERLPSRRIRTRFEIVQQPLLGQESDTRKRPSRKLPALKSKKTGNAENVTSPGDQKKQLDGSSRHILPLPPPLVDVMMLSPGVIAKVGSVIKSGPKATATDQWNEHHSRTSTRWSSDMSKQHDPDDTAVFAFQSSMSPQDEINRRTTNHHHVISAGQH